MLFETENTYVSVAGNSDIGRIVEIYNSSPDFLSAHMDKTKVDANWVKNETATMQDIGFFPCKLVFKATDTVFGVLDFSLREESYLSLLMIHSDFKNKGLGSDIYRGLENFVKSKGSRRISLDVVTGYDQGVIDFWTAKGFGIVGTVELNWTGKALSAVTMKKIL